MEVILASARLVDRDLSQIFLLNCITLTVKLYVEEPPSLIARCVTWRAVHVRHSILIQAMEMQACRFISQKFFTVTISRSPLAALIVGISQCPLIPITGQVCSALKFVKTYDMLESYVTITRYTKVESRENIERKVDKEKVIVRIVL